MASMAFFKVPTAGGGTPTPALMQHVASAANPPGVGISGNAFKIPVPNRTGAGNCLILAMTYPHGNTVSSISDSVNGSWSTTPAKSVDAGVGGYISAIFVFPNITAGQSVITVTFNASIIPFNYTLSEVTNIAVSSPVNGTGGTANVSGPSLSVGAFTPGNNNANGGNYVWSYFAVSGGAGGNPSSWVPGGSFTLLDGDIAWTTNQGFPHASMYFTQTTAASINPAITATGDSADSFNCVAIALKASTDGTPKPSGIQINKILHFTDAPVPATWPLQCPATGNLWVLTNTSGNFTNVTDNKGGTWVGLNTVDAQIWYSVNRTPALDLIVTTHQPAGQNGSARFYDVQGAAAAAFDTTATTTSTGLNGASVFNNAPASITPTVSNGLTICVLQLGQGPGLGVTSPAGAIFDLVNYTGETDMDLMENADGNAHFYYSTTAAQTWNWSITNNATNSGTACAATFKHA